MSCTNCIWVYTLSINFIGVIAVSDYLILSADEILNEARLNFTKGGTHSFQVANLLAKSRYSQRKEASGDLLDSEVASNRFFPQVSLFCEDGDLLDIDILFFHIEARLRYYAQDEVQYLKKYYNQFAYAYDAVEKGLHVLKYKRDFYQKALRDMAWFSCSFPRFGGPSLPDRLALAFAGSVSKIEDVKALLLRHITHPVDSLFLHVHNSVHRNKHEYVGVDLEACAPYGVSTFMERDRTRLALEPSVAKEEFCTMLSEVYDGASVSS